MELEHKSLILIVRSRKPTASQRLL